MTVKQTLKIGIGVILGTALSAFIYYRVRLFNVYKNVSTVNEAITDMQNPNTVFVNTNNEEILSLDAEYESNNDLFQYSNGADEIDYEFFGLETQEEKNDFLSAIDDIINGNFSTGTW